MDHGGPIPLSEIWWSRVFLWRVLDQMRLYHNSYVPVPATFVFRKSLPQTSDDVVPSLATILQQADKKVLLVGDPGSGKSWSAKALVYEMAHHSFWSLLTLPVIPVYISNPSLIQDSWLETFEGIVRELWSLSEPMPGPELSNILQQLLKNGKLVVLFDGLDNLTDEQNKKLTRLLDQLTNNKRSTSTSLMFIRRGIMGEMLSVPYEIEAQIFPLTDVAVRKFLIQKNKVNVEMVEQLMAELRDAGWLDPSSPGRNPLYLTFLAEGGKFNPNRGITLLTQIEKLIRELPPNYAARCRWTPVQFPEQAMRALAYLAFKI